MLILFCNPRPVYAASGIITNVEYSSIVKPYEWDKFLISVDYDGTGYWSIEAFYEGEDYTDPSIPPLAERTEYLTGKNTWTAELDIRVSHVETIVGIRFALWFSEDLTTWVLLDTLVCQVIVTYKQPPVANAGGPYTGYEGSPIIFNGTSSYDPDGTVVSYRWDLDGDGEYDDAAGASPEYVWNDDYSGIIGLKVTDMDGFTDMSTTTVTVENVAPTVEVGANQSANVGDTVTFSGSFVDPGADTHTFEWDFGDGETASGTLTPSHVYANDGEYAVTLRVTDKDGAFGEDTLTLNVKAIPWWVALGWWCGMFGLVLLGGLVGLLKLRGVIGEVPVLPPPDEITDFAGEPPGRVFVLGKKSDMEKLRDFLKNPSYTLRGVYPLLTYHTPQEVPDRKNRDWFVYLPEKDPEGKGQKGWFKIIDYDRVIDKRGNIVDVTPDGENPNVMPVEQCSKEIRNRFEENIRQFVFPTEWQRAWAKFKDVSANQLAATSAGLAVLTGNDHLLRIYLKMANELKQGKPLNKVLEKYWVDIIEGAAISIAFNLATRGLVKFFSHGAKILRSSKALGKKGQNAIKAIEKALKQNLEKATTKKAREEAVRQARKQIDDVYWVVKQRRRFQAVKAQVIREGTKVADPKKVINLYNRKIGILNKQLDRVTKGKPILRAHHLFSRTGKFLDSIPHANSKIDIKEGPFGRMSERGYHAAKHGVVEKIGDTFYNDPGRYIKGGPQWRQARFKFVKDKRLNRMIIWADEIVDTTRFTRDASNLFNKYAKNANSTIWKGQYRSRAGKIFSMQTNVDFRCKGKVWRIAVDDKTGQILNFFEVETGESVMKYTNIKIIQQGNATKPLSWNLYR